MSDTLQINRFQDLRLSAEVSGVYEVGSACQRHLHRVFASLLYYSWMLTQKQIKVRRMGLAETVSRVYQYGDCVHQDQLH